MAQGDTLLNAAIGAVVSVVLTFLPFSPVLGGGVAAYLQGGDRREGVRVGALSGALAALPLVVVFALVASVFTVVAVAGAPRASFFFLFLALVAFVFVAAYGVVLGAVGGYLAAYLADEDVL